jgi:hypothetical protein
MIGFLLALMVACPAYLLDQADRIRAESGRLREVAYLERELARCVADDRIHAQVSNRYIELAQGPEGRARRDHWMNEAFRHAKLAMARNTRSSVGNEIMATAYAAKLEQSGLIGQARLADSVRVYAERAVAYDPTNPTAHHILGRWHAELASVSWVTGLFAGMVTQADVASAPATALRHFREAQRLQDTVRNRYWVVKALQRTGDLAAARTLAQETVRRSAEGDAEKTMQAELRAWLRMNPR